MLWKDENDQTLFESIKRVKRESRIARDNSEDAVSWNVIRYLERNILLGKFLTEISKTEQKIEDVIYWSYSQKENAQWSKLNKARVEFGEKVERGSEPDILVLTDKTLFFIEAKVTASNETIPSNLEDSKAYKTGGDNWFDNVFSSTYETISIAEKRYELLRFWLLGTWLAKELDVNFRLVNLVLDEQELNIENEFGKHIKQNDNNKFSRYTWEKIYRFVQTLNLNDSETQIFNNYVENKTIGYNKQELQTAFLR